MSVAMMRSLEAPMGSGVQPAAAEERAIDLVHLSRQTLGDRDLEIELLGLFERQAEQIMRQIAATGVATDSRLRHDLAHTLRGSARAVGACAVAHAAQTYENSVCASAPEAEIRAAAETLQRAVEAARGAIAAWLQER